MGKRLLSWLTGVILLLTLGGCWNYHGLDQMTIVIGIAVDFDQEAQLFDISYEVADLKGAEKERQVGGRVIQTQGKTLFDAARNAKRKESDRLFFGSANVLLIGQQIIEDIGILPILDWFLRDGECRETLCVAISQQETAGELLEAPEENSDIVSVALNDILTEDRHVTGTVLHHQLYQLYDTLLSPRRSAMVPAVRKVESGDGEIPEVNGMAVIKGDKLIGFLPPEQSRYVLMAEGKLDSGILTLSMADMPTDDISLEIFLSSANKSYTYREGKITVRIETDTKVAIAENLGNIDVMDKQAVQEVEAAAAGMIEENIKELADILQQEFGADVLGFGEMIYKKDVKLWKQLEPSWDEIYPTVEVEVSSQVQVTNSAFTK